MTDSITRFDSPVLAERYDQMSTSQFENGVLLIQEPGIKKGDRILDIGCGTGRLIEHIITTFGDSVEIVGLEPSEYHIHIARQKGAVSPTVTFSHGSGRDLHTFADNSLILCISMLFSITSGRLRRNLQLLCRFKEFKNRAVNWAAIQPKRVSSIPLAGS